MGIIPKNYPEFVKYNPRYERYVVTIPQAKLRKIKQFAPKMVKEKLKESHYKSDSDSLKKRIITGLIGEAALEELLGIPIIDWTVGNSKKYNKPDIKELGVGIKTVEYGLYPLVRIKPNHPQIICVKTEDDKVIVCGVATVETQIKYQDKKLVRPKGARARGTKAGFYGFQFLERFTTLSRLKQILNKINKDKKL